MTTWPYSNSTHVLGHQKLERADADEIRCMVLNMNCPGSNIIVVRTVKVNK